MVHPVRFTFVCVFLTVLLLQTQAQVVQDTNAASLSNAPVGFATRTRGVYGDDETLTSLGDAKVGVYHKQNALRPSYQLPYVQPYPLPYVQPYPLPFLQPYRVPSFSPLGQFPLTPYSHRPWKRPVYGSRPVINRPVYGKPGKPGYGGVKPRGGFLGGDLLGGVLGGLGGGLGAGLLGGVLG